MYIDNIKKAAAYRLAVAFIGIITILYDCGFFEFNIKFSGFMYFTIISNLLCCLMLFACGIKNIRELKKREKDQNKLSSKRNVYAFNYNYNVYISFCFSTECT